MIFTTKAEYGVRLLVELGRQPSDSPVSLKAIAESEGLPLAYLERIVALLKRAELVESTRGAAGGYRLVRDPANLSLGEVVTIIEGASGDLQSNAPRSTAAKWRRAGATSTAQAKSV